MINSLALLCFFFATSTFAQNQDGELIPFNESNDIATVVKIIETTVMGVYKKEGHGFRDAHRKQHGCVNANFEVLNLKKPFRYGVFGEVGDHSAVIRFSNGSGSSQDDRVPDGRGMAIKVRMNSPATKLLNIHGEEDSQDFVMINHPRFFVRNASDYVKFNENPLKFLAMHPFHEGAIAAAIATHPMSTPLAARYFSMVPSKLGPQQMKFSVRPCAGQKLVTTFGGANKLRDNLAAQLAGSKACFEFQVQLRKDPANMPIEDATQTWDEKKSPFMTVARIHIPSQTPDIGATCENMTYNPWHGVNDLRPLGGISRVRKEVYLAISRLRLKLNGVQN